MKKRPRGIAVEIRRKYVAVVQGTDRIAVLPRQDAGDLPDPDEVRAACDRAGIQGRFCTMILPRREWLLHIGAEQKGKRSEVLSAARLEIEVAANAGEEEMLTAVSVLGRSDLRTYGAMLFRHRAEQHVQWAKACGWDVVDIRCSSLEAVREKVFRQVGVLLVFYPGGEWELHWVHRDRLTATYAGEGPLDQGELFQEELLRALAAMCVSHGVKEEALPNIAELSGDVPWDESELHMDVLIDGPAPSGIENVFHRLVSWLRDEGVAAAWQWKREQRLQQEAAPWPGAAVFGALEHRQRGALIDRWSRAARGEYPAVRWISQGSRPSSFWAQPAKQMMASAVLLALITGGVGFMRNHVQRELAAIQTSSSILQSSSERLAGERARREALEEQVREVRTFFGQRHHVIHALLALDNVLPAGSRVETLTIDDDRLRVALVAPSVVAVISAMEGSDEFSDVVMESPVTVERRGESRWERVSVVARVVGGVAHD